MQIHVSGTLFPGSPYYFEDHGGLGDRAWLAKCVSLRLPPIRCAASCQVNKPLRPMPITTSPVSISSRRQGNREVRQTLSPLSCLCHNTKILRKAPTHRLHTHLLRAWLPLSQLSLIYLLESSHHQLLTLAWGTCAASISSRNE